MAKLLGVAIHTAYDLIYRGQLEAEVTGAVGPKRRRRVRVRRSAVAGYLDAARIRPGL